MDEHKNNCGCGYDHQCLEGESMRRWLFALAIIMCVFVLGRSFVVKEMLSRAAAYFTYSSYDDVIRICKKIIMLDANNLRAWTSLGYAYKEKGDIDAAIRAYEKVFTLDPQDKGAMFDLGMAFYVKKDFANALSYLERIRSLGPDTRSSTSLDIINYHRSSLSMLEECYQRLGNFTEVQRIKQEMAKHYPVNNQSVRMMFRRDGKSE